MTRIRIAAVSYLNTIPFIYGIEHGSNDLRAELVLSPPSGCAAALRNGQADIALLPVAAHAAFPDFEPITSYCIGAHGPVRTVVLASNTPLSALHTIHLDSHSLTSVQLVRLLCAELWHLTPQWEPLYDYTLPQQHEPGHGYLLIGDKVFEHESHFTYIYDLAAAWQELTGLPFVFAAWVAPRQTDALVIDALEKALAYGVGHVDEAIAESSYADRPYAHDYLTRNIDFRLDPSKRQAMELFRQKILEAEPPADPG